VKGTPPDAAGPVSARLAGELRELRTRTGLSMAALGRSTAYSKSSWERYLNGKQLVPRQAVEALCAMAGEPAGRLVALWELADLEWSGRAGTAARPTAAARPDGNTKDEDGSLPERKDEDASLPEQDVRAPESPGPTRRKRWVVTAALGGAGLVAGVGVAVFLTVGSGEHAGEAAPTARPALGCRARGCTGKDPQAMGCGTPGRVKRVGPRYRTRTGASVEIRYDPACDAAWARVWNSDKGDLLEVSVPGHRTQRVEVADKYDAEGSNFTSMVDGSDLTRLRVCFVPAGGGSREWFPR
jgi:transcriptional regulator with XRE-family HTH domain